MTALSAPAERAHAVLSASGAHRWLICAPSARLEERLPNPSSPFAEEGTLAHAVAETELARWLFRLDGADYQDAWKTYLQDPRVTRDFRDAVKRYVDFAIERIQDARSRNKDAVILLEERLNYSYLVPEGFGTGDLITVADGVLEVIDLKFGQGVPVSPEHNPQAMLYGLGALAVTDMLYDIHTVRLTIHQPRVGDGEPRSWELPKADLFRWGYHFVAPRADLAWRGEGDFVPGEHCKFCRAAAQCRARAEHNLALEQRDFADPELLGDFEIAHILSRIEPLLSWATAVRNYALETAKQGRKLPGWKLVRGRSVRAYGDTEAVIKALTGAGIPEAALYERRLLGITALEKAIGKKQFAELLPEPLVTKPPGALALAPSTDPRAEVESSALEGFADLTEKEPA
jgi:hypothetical protein